MTGLDKYFSSKHLPVQQYNNIYMLSSTFIVMAIPVITIVIIFFVDEFLFSNI